MRSFACRLNSPKRDDKARRQRDHESHTNHGLTEAADASCATESSHGREVLFK